MRMCYEEYKGEDGGVELLPLLLDTAERIDDRWDLKLDVDKVQDELDGSDDYAEIYDTIMIDLFLKGTSKGIWCEKTTNVWFEALEFLKMFPEGKVIHIVRDPLDVLASWKKFTHAPGNDYLDIVFNCYASSHQAKVFNDLIDDYMMVEYEDLVEHPEKSAKRIANFLDIDYKPHMIDSSHYKDKSGDKWTGNSMFGESIDGIEKNNQENREEYLESWEVDLVNMVFENSIPHAQNLEVIVEELNKSQIASDGMMRYLLLNEGVQRFPLDPTDPENWESEKEQLNKWREG